MCLCSNGRANWRQRRRRFGYRRLGYLLAREGMTPNHEKLLRIFREEGLLVRRRGGRM